MDSAQLSLYEYLATSKVLLINTDGLCFSGADMSSFFFFSDGGNFHLS